MREFNTVARRGRCGKKRHPPKHKASTITCTQDGNAALARILAKLVWTTYILGSLLVRIFREGEGLGEGAWPFLQLSDDEDQTDRKRHPRRHVEQPATINMMGWRSLTLSTKPVRIRFPSTPVKNHGDGQEWIRAINLSIPFGRSPREIDFLRTGAHPRWWWWPSLWRRSFILCQRATLLFDFICELWMTDRSGESDSSWEFLLLDELLSDSFFFLLFPFFFWLINWWKKRIGFVDNWN